jgi:hypothetical protein
MENHSVLIADRTPLFAMDMEGLLRSNGFEGLRIDSIQDENELMPTMASVEPEVLMLGELNTSEPSARSEYYVPVIPELLVSYPTLHILDIRNGSASSDQPMSNRLIRMDKPLDSEELMRTVTDWFDETSPPSGLPDDDAEIHS